MRGTRQEVACGKFNCGNFLDEGSVERAKERRGKSGEQKRRRSQATPIGCEEELAVYARSGRESVRLGAGNGACRLWIGEAGTGGVDGVGVVGAKAKLFKRTGIRGELGLPALVCLKLLHGRDGCAVPLASGLTGEVVLPYKGLLYLVGSCGINTLLAAELCATSLLSSAGCAALLAVRRAVRGARMRS